MKLYYMPGACSLLSRLRLILLYFTNQDQPFNTLTNSVKWDVVEECYIQHVSNVPDCVKTLFQQFFTQSVSVLRQANVA